MIALVIRTPSSITRVKVHGHGISGINEYFQKDIQVSFKRESNGRYASILCTPLDFFMGGSKV